MLLAKENKPVAGSFLKQPKKFLFANFPADGHFNPLTGLAMHLKEAGHDVRWYTQDLYAKKLEKLGIQHYPFKKALQFNQFNIEEIFPERKALKSQVKKLKFDLINVFIKRCTEFYEDIKEIDQTFNFDVLICDVGFTGAPFIKDKMNKPVISVGVMPLTEYSKDLPPVGLGMTPSYSFSGQLKQSFLRFATNQFIFKEANDLIKDLFKQHNMDFNANNCFDVIVKKSTLVLQSGIPEFEYHRSDIGRNVRFIGAVLPYSRIHNNTYQLNEKYKKYQKIILVTQGTVEKDPAKIIVPVLEAFKDTNYLVIATTGGSGTQALKERYKYDNVIIEDFIPFTDIMPHCHVYITNGGYGGVMLGIENKLPLIVAGIHEGKNEINARVGYFKLGINLKTETPSALQMKMAVEAVLQDPEYKTNAVRYSEKFKTYKPAVLCEQYIAELLEK